MKEDLLYNPFFWAPLLTGIFYFALGYIMIKYPPKFGNGIYGYRTPRANKSVQHWNFAQKFSAIMFKKLGVLCLPLCTLGMISEGKSETVFAFITIAIILFPIGVVVYLTEKYLKEI